MGTRADFYVGRGLSAEWLGSTAWDGYPSGYDTKLFKYKTVSGWRTAVTKMLAARKDGTTPDKGWPWPWEDSQTTDYAYAFEGGKVWGSCFGGPWFDPLKPEPEYEELEDSKKVPFPNMKSRQKVTLGERSGVLVISAPKIP